jgi:hypothetical protein
MRLTPFGASLTAEVANARICSAPWSSAISTASAMKERSRSCPSASIDPSSPEILSESEHLLVRGGRQGRCSDVGVDDQEVDAVGADIEDC